MNQSPPHQQPQQFQQQPQGRPCPYCMSAINPAATVCPVCTRDLPQPGRMSRSSAKIWANLIIVAICCGVLYFIYSKYKSDTARDALKYCNEALESARKKPTPLERDYDLNIAEGHCTPDRAAEIEALRR